MKPLKQRDTFRCGVYSLINALRHIDKRAHSRDVGWLTISLRCNRATGTSEGNLLRALQNSGFRCQLRTGFSVMRHRASRYGSITLTLSSLDGTEGHWCNVFTVGKTAVTGANFYLLSQPKNPGQPGHRGSGYQHEVSREEFNGLKKVMTIYLG